MKDKKVLFSVFSVIFFFGLIFAGCKKEASIPVSVTPDLQEAGFVISGITAVAFSPEDIYMASGTGEGSVMIWDINKSARIHSFRAGNYAITAAAFRPDKPFFAAGSSSGEITVWNLDDSAMGSRGSMPLLRIISPSAVASILYNREGTEIISLSADGEIFRWDSNKGALISREAAGPDAFNAAALTTDGKQILYGREGSLCLAGLPGWEEQGKFSGINGKVLAAAAGGNKLAASGEENIMIWNNSKNSKTNIPVKEKISAIAVNANETRMLTGSASGVTRIWNMDTGEEIIMYMSFGTADEAGEWISMLPSGHYNASDFGAVLMKVSAGGDSYLMSQFSNALFRPDLLSKAIREGAVPKSEKTIENYAAKTPPLVEIIGPRSMTVDGSSVDINIRITVRSGGLGNLKLTKAASKKPKIIGYKPLDTTLKQYKENGRQVYEAVVTAPLEPGRNVIGVAAYGESLDVLSASANVSVNTSWKGPDADKPVLHLLAMNIQHYQNPKKHHSLDYTKKDADEIANLFLKQLNGGLYRDVKIYQREGGQVTKEGFLKAFNDVAKETGRNDHFVFFYAGHGDVKNGDFYFVPYDSIGQDNPHEKNITMNDIVSAITEVQAKHSLVLLDTCNSGTILEAENSAFRRLIDELNEKAIITATLGDQKALETAEEEHGLFTASLLASYGQKNNPNDMNENIKQYVTVADIIDFTNNDVPQRFEKLGMNVASASQRGAYKEDYITIQRPLFSKPGEDFTNFQVFDRYTEKGLLEIKTVTAGTVNLYRMYRDGDSDDFDLEAGSSKTRQLAPGRYKASILYKDGEAEEKEIDVRGFPDPGMTRYVPAKTVLSFEYREAKPGEVRIRTTSAGILRIKGQPDEKIDAGAALTKTLPPGQHNVSIEYIDKYIETRTASVSNNSVMPLNFTYKLAIPEGFVFIPAGSFTMGSPASESQRQNNEEQHRVTISKSFYMSAHTITQKDFREVTGNSPSIFKGDNLPVENITWLEAVNYCNARSTKEGLKPAYNIRNITVTLVAGANGYRLPTEAEWEYACRAGTTGPYYTGGSISANQANYNSSNRRTREAGGFSPNNWGLYDMAGNVWEWCWDWFAPHNSSAVTDPVGPADGEKRIVRGGGFNSTLVSNLRSAYRGFDLPNDKKEDLGFRVVRVHETPRR